MDGSNVSGEPAVHINQNNDQQMPLPRAQYQAKIYECNFCARGFSNAQALGGHMNIHRKDKEKVKAKKFKSQSLQNPPNNQHQFVIGIPSNTWSALPLENFKNSYMEDQRAANYMVLTNLDFTKEDDDTATGTATSRNKSDNGLLQYSVYDDDDDDDDDEDGDGFLEAELDLELRLGHQQPTQSNTTPMTMSTRNFF